MYYQRHLNAWIIIVATHLIVSSSLVSLDAYPLGNSTIQATHVTRNGYPSSSASEIPNRGGGGLFDLPALLRKYLPVIPNTYYDIPKHRYPYYDENGSGRLLYGYGGKTLYKYSVFKPLEGYFR